MSADDNAHIAESGYELLGEESGKLFFLARRHIPALVELERLVLGLPYEAGYEP